MQTHDDASMHTVNTDRDVTGMSDSGPWQVIVVGGGPAGASAAWHCAQAGLSVCLVDRARFPRSKPCAEYLSPKAVASSTAWARWPISSRVRQPT